MSVESEQVRKDKIAFQKKQKFRKKPKKLDNSKAIAIAQQKLENSEKALVKSQITVEQLKAENKFGTAGYIREKALLAKNIQRVEDCKNQVKVEKSKKW